MEWEKLLSRERLRQSKSTTDPFDKRSSFDGDFDRVVFSSSFRRLQDKTQVFPLEAHDFVRTRLTHSSEVAAVGRALGISTARVLHERELMAADYGREWSTIVATACMLHDIGNPPFGHSGEKYIGSWFTQKLTDPTKSRNEKPLRTRQGAPLELPDDQEARDLKKFEGNAHAFRVATRIQTLGSSFGMNLTCGTLAALIKYPCSSTQTEAKKQPDERKQKSREKFGYFKSDARAFERVRKSVGLTGHTRHPLTFLVEAADDIAYSVVDIEDALKKRVVSFELVESYLSKLPEELKKEFLEEQLHAQLSKLADVLPLSERHQLAFQNFRVYAIGKMIASCVELFCNEFDEIIAGDFDDELTKKMRLEPLCSVLKDLGDDHVYSTSEVVKVEETGKHVIWGLLDIFYDELRYKPDSRLIQTFLPKTQANEGDVEVSEQYALAQRVADYVAGMTDTFAVALYRRLTGVAQ